MFVATATMSLILFYVSATMKKELQELSDKDPSLLPDDPALLKELLSTLLEIIAELESGLTLMISDLAWVGVFVLIASGITFFLARRIVE